ncbi:hypothetical protein Acr_17g0009550 [Actinidia rufa]|uniref:Uncharacterized protein n=1 Tax=Actinidia rufa TaxID=165716 RepID=A0A7J0G3M7_9ERIC|nr:hypothetical protein Acr_17g0009550 [Actinidia rufa]
MESQIGYWIQVVLTTYAEIERCSLHMQHASDVYGWRTTQLAELLAKDQFDSAWQTGGVLGGSVMEPGGSIAVQEHKEMLWDISYGGAGPEAVKMNNLKNIGLSSSGLEEEIYNMGLCLWVQQ